MATALRELHAAMEAADAGKAENRLAKVAAERDAAQEPRAYRAALEDAKGGGREDGRGLRCDSDANPIRFRFNSAFDSELIAIGVDSNPIPIPVRFDSIRSDVDSNPIRLRAFLSPQVEHVVFGDIMKAPARVDEREILTTPVLHCSRGVPTHVVPFDEKARQLGRKPFVVVMGPWRTGTNVLVAYLKRFFDVDIPSVGDRSWKLANYEFPVTSSGMWWKHEPMRTPVLMPESHQGRPVFILATIREPTRWINALAFGAYELQAGRGNWHWRNRGKGDHRWLTEGPVQFVHPLTKEVLEYSSGDELWCEYAYGLMKGRLATQSERLRTRVVRHEDLVLQPLVVLEGLAMLGLPRKMDPLTRQPIPFEEICDVKGGHCTNKSRSNAQLKVEVMYGGVWQQHCLQKVAERLQPMGRLLDVFGYARRDGGFLVEPVNTFGASLRIEDVLGDDEEPEEPARVREERERHRAASVPAKPVGPAPLLK